MTIASDPANLTNTVKATLTPKRAGRVTETAEFAAFTRRIMRALGRRIGGGGDVDALPELMALASEVDAVITQSVAGLRAEGYSWAEISARLGTTRQAAQQRFGRAITNELTALPPVDDDDYPDQCDASSRPQKPPPPLHSLADLQSTYLRAVMLSSQTEDRGPLD